MRLTKNQVRTLRYYLDHQDRSPTWMEFLHQGALRLFLYLLVGAIAAVVCDVTGIPQIGWLAVGMLLGAALRDVGHYALIIKVWPVIRQIIDWRRAELLLADPASSGA